jgi:hypothetical protein
MIIGQLIVDLIPFDIELTSFTANAIFIRIKVVGISLENIDASDNQVVGT